MRYSSCTSTSYACRTADKYNNKYISRRSINLASISISQHPSHHTFLERNRYIFQLKSKWYSTCVFNNILPSSHSALRPESIVYYGKETSANLFSLMTGSASQMLPHPLAVFSVLRLSSDSYSRLLRVSALM